MPRHLYSAGGCVGTKPLSFPAPCLLVKIFQLAPKHRTWVRKPKGWEDQEQIPLKSKAASVGQGADR